MKLMEIDESQWVDNCIECHVACLPVFNDKNETLYGDRNYVLNKDSRMYEKWIELGCVMSGKIFFCPECNSLWGTACNEYVKIIDSGITIEPLPVKPLIVEKVIDRTPPFAHATMCSECHEWKHIVHTEVVEEQGKQYVVRRHLCMKCLGPTDIKTEITNEEKKTHTENPFLFSQGVSEDQRLANTELTAAEKYRQGN